MNSTHRPAPCNARPWAGHALACVCGGEGARYAPDTVIGDSPLNTMPADKVDAPVSALAPGWIDGAQPGLCCHLFIEGSWQAARLVWVSAARTQCRSALPRVK